MDETADPVREECRFVPIASARVIPSKRDPSMICLLVMNDGCLPDGVQRGPPVGSGIGPATHVQARFGTGGWIHHRGAGDRAHPQNYVAEVCSLRAAAAGAGLRAAAGTAAWHVEDGASIEE